MPEFCDAALLQAARDVWPFDREPLRMGVEDGVVWAVVPSPTVGVNGYALIPAEGHPFSAGWPAGELDAVFKVHGGVTYSNHPWVGFDTGHAFDVWDGEYDQLGICGPFARSSPLTRRWTVDAVVEEAKELARQVRRLA